MNDKTVLIEHFNTSTQHDSFHSFLGGKINKFRKEQIVFNEKEKYFHAI